MDGSTGNRNPHRQGYLAERHHGPWMADEGLRNHGRSGCGAKRSQ
jgi:hypothetical protein